MSILQNQMKWSKRMNTSTLYEDVRTNYVFELFFNVILFQRGLCTALSVRFILYLVWLLGPAGWIISDQKTGWMDFIFFK